MNGPASLLRLFARRRVLVLQGPMGPFFSHLGEVLCARGAQVWRVNFNGGDDWYTTPREQVIRFTDAPARWPERLAELLQSLQIDSIVLFGQSRPLHQAAIELARAHGLAVFVFEEGYVRPDYVTLELGGVNGWSSIPRHRSFYDTQSAEAPATPEPTHQQFGRVAGIAMTYALAMLAGRSRYPHYEHHRSLHPINEGSRWLRGFGRKWMRRTLEVSRLGELTHPNRSYGWFLVPLQVHNDAQVRDHSPFTGGMPDFITAVMQSFAQHAPPALWLVFKHHPLDRPYNDYSSFIAAQARALGIAERIRYIHDQHLPTLLKHTRGVVTINSTTGLQALYHGTPVLTLGDCLYAVPGLVHAGPLETFWHEPGAVDAELFQRFRAYLVQQSQLNASFYGRTPGLPLYSSEASARRLSSSAID
jgi:capsular polysaccharide export protein